MLDWLSNWRWSLRLLIWSDRRQRIYQEVLGGRGPRGPRRFRRRWIPISLSFILIVLYLLLARDTRPIRELSERINSIVTAAASYASLEHAPVAAVLIGLIAAGPLLVWLLRPPFMARLWPAFEPNFWWIVVCCLSPLLAAHSWLFMFFDQPESGHSYAYTDVLLGAISSVIMSLLIAVFVVSWRYYAIRQRHIVYQLQYSVDRQSEQEKSAAEIAEESDLRSISLTLTHLLALQLQRTGRAMSLRQVESLKTQAESPLSLLVTNGQEEGLVQQLEQLDELQVSNVSVPFGRFLAFILGNRADTRVRGALHRTKDGATEVWVNVYSRRHGQTFDLGRRVIRRPSDDEPISESELQDIARDFAIRIAHALGNTLSRASSPESLSALVDGLEASSQNNWWYAVTNYQRSVALEEANRSKHIPAYFYIGATLLRQGEPRLALEQLRLAEERGALSAELAYMLGLTLFTLSSNMNDDANLSTALTYLERAVALDPSLLEAYHLLGIIEYNRGRRFEREGGNHTAIDDGERRAYQMAERWFQICYRRYESRITRLMRRQHPADSYAPELVDAVQAQLMVAHHWADSLRSLDRPRLANLLYQDAQLAYSVKTRNLVDQLLNACRAGDITTGSALLRRHIQSHPKVYWSADAQLYVAWLRMLEAARSQSRSASATVYRAFPHLDLALQLRPRFIDVRRQTNWRIPWARLIGSRWDPALLGVADLDLVFEGPLMPVRRRIEAGHEALRGTSFDTCAVSIALRDYGYRAHRPDASVSVVGGVPRSSPLRAFFGMPVPEDERSFWRRHLPIHRDFLACRTAIAAFLFCLDRQGELYSQQIVERRHLHAQAAYQIWLRSNAAWQKLLANGPAQPQISLVSVGLADQPITFGMRWALDVYLQTSLMACAQLASVDSFSHVRQIASQTIHVLEAWLEYWRAQSEDGKPMHGLGRFSPAILRYFLVTLLVWRAFAALRTAQPGAPPADGEEMARLKTLFELRNAVSEHGYLHHPLYLYVCAEYYAACGMMSEAMNSLIELLSVTEVYDARTFNPFNFTLGVISEDLVRRSSEFEDESLRRQLFYFERVSGQQQFEFFVNHARVFTKMSEVAAKSGDTRASISYLFDALTWSPYGDLDLENFVKLVSRLIYGDQFQEALAVVQEARSRLGSYPVDTTQSGNILTLDVAQCILHTRLRRYDVSLQLGLSLARHDATGQPRTLDLARLEQSYGALVSFLQHLLTAGAPPEMSSTEDRSRVAGSPPLADWDMVAALFNSSFQRISRHGVRGPAQFIDPSFEHVLQYADAYLRSSQLPIDEPAADQTYEANIIAHQRFVAVMSRRFFAYIYQACELYNNIAYNLALLEIHMDQAFHYVWTAIRFMDSLYVKVTAPAQQQNKAMLARIRERLAQYYDTLAWIHYRRRGEQGIRQELAAAMDAIDAALNPAVSPPAASLPGSDLQIAIFFLERQSLAFSQHLPVPHYHLSRAYLALAEESMQDRGASGQTPQIGEHQLRQYVHKSLRHWEIAQALDQTGRLAEDLRRQRNRIDPLRKSLRDAISPSA